MYIALVLSLVAQAFACDSCYGPVNSVEHVRHVKRIQPQAPEASYGPKGPLEWGQVNFLHTTDTHGWLAGHLKEQNYGADWGDFVTFTRHMKQTAGNMGVDLLLIDTGDLHDGAGLSDATEVDGERSNPIFEEIDYDLLTIGNHELYVSEVAEQTFTDFALKWGDRYVTSNVKIFNKTSGEYEYVGSTHRYFTTPKGLRVMAFGVLFDFTGNSNASQIIKAKDMVEESWFQEALATKAPIDMFILFGHNPARASDYASTFSTVFDAIRKTHAKTPIQIFGGHSHLRDFAVYDESSVAIESGRYCETLGWVSMSGFNPKNSGFHGVHRPHGVKNPTRKAIQGSKSPFTYSRRYLDWNRKTFIFHSRTSANKFDYHSGLRVTNEITEVREELKLGDVYGCAPQTYCMSCVPFNDSSNIFPGVIEPAVAKIVVNEDRKNKSRLIIGNTGGIRFDLHQGPFTYDDNFVVSPFRDVFLYLQDVPYSKAQTVLGQLNGSGAEKRASMPLLHDDCQNPALNSVARRDIGVVRRQELTDGYATTDDWGSDGDDTEHTGIPNYSIPSYWESKANFPDDVPEKVDLIFIDFIESSVLSALGDDFTSDMVDCYIDCDFTLQDFMLPYAKAVWQDNIDDCPLEA